MRQSADPTNDLIYTESISSNKTEALFLAHTLLFLLLLIWRVNVGSWDVPAVVLLCFCIFFFFYSVNYRTFPFQRAGRMTLYGSFMKQYRQTGLLNMGIQQTRISLHSTQMADTCRWMHLRTC
jgi:hypothetical protein